MRAIHRAGSPRHTPAPAPARRAACLLVAILLAALSASGALRYVDPLPAEAGSGWDGIDGHPYAGEPGPGTGYATIQAALNAMSGGDDIHMRGGVYTEDNYAHLNDGAYPHILIPDTKNGTAEDWSSLQSYPGEWAIIDGQGTHPPYGQPQRPPLGNLVATGDRHLKYWLFERFEVRNGDRYGIYANRGPLIFRYLYIHDNYSPSGSDNPAGLCGYTWQHCIVEYCVFHTNGGPPGYTNANCAHVTIFTDYSGSHSDSFDLPDIDGAAHSNEIRYNFFDANSMGFKHKGAQRLGDTTGRDMEYADRGDKVHHNVFVDQSQAGVDGGADFLQIHNNIFVNARLYATMQISHAYHVTFHPTVYNNTCIGQTIAFPRVKMHYDYCYGSTLYGGCLFMFNADRSFDYHPYWWCVNNIVDSGRNGWDTAQIAMSQAVTGWPNHWADGTTPGTVDLSDAVVDRNFVTRAANSQGILVADHYSVPLYTPTATARMGFLTTAEYNAAYGTRNYTNENPGLWRGTAGAGLYKTNPDFVVDTAAGTTVRDGGKGGAHPFLAGVTLPGYIGAVNPGDDFWVDGLFALKTRDAHGIPVVLRDTRPQAADWVEGTAAHAVPAVRRQPRDAAVETGARAVFFVDAAGGRLAYRWTKQAVDAATGAEVWEELAEGGAYEGTATAVLSIPAVTAGMAGSRFRCVVANTQGTTTSAEAVLSVPGATTVTVTLGALTRAYDGLPKPVTVTTEPAGIATTVTYAGSATAPSAVGAYAVAASVDDPLYRGSATGTLTIAPALGSDAGTAGASHASAGASLTLGASADGGACRWQRLVATDPPGLETWEDLPGTAGTARPFPCVQLFHAGTYRAVVTKDGADYPSAAHVLTVSAPAPSDARPMNVSTRALCLTGDDVLIPGFVVEGTGAKRLLMRAVGPELARYGVATFLPDPQMRLEQRQPGQSWLTLAQNDDWEGNANAADIPPQAALLGAFPLDPGSASAALLMDVPAGIYTIVAGGKPSAGSGQGGTGVAIVELYDADASSATARLINISNRGYVGTGSDIMIPGFVVSEQGPKTFLVRAVGPTLRQWLTGELADPMIQIYGSPAPGQEAPLLLASDTWGENGDAAAIRAAATTVGAFPLDEGSADAAFVVTLPPGAYTVHARGVGGATGIALVEVYLVP